MTADIFWIGPNSNVICTFSFIFHKLCKSDIFLYITHKKRIHEKKIFQAKVNQTYVISNDNKTIDWTWKKFRLKQLRGLQRSCYFFSYVSSIRCFFSFTRKHPPDCGLRFLILAQPVFEGLEFLSRFLTNWFKIRAIPINKALCAPLSLPRWLRIPVYVTQRQNETITTNELAFI